MNEWMNSFLMDEIYIQPKEFRKSDCINMEYIYEKSKHKIQGTDKRNHCFVFQQLLSIR
jgi:hypothetical protein